jgi:hypothetical protein
VRKDWGDKCTQSRSLPLLTNLVNKIIPLFKQLFKVFIYLFFEPFLVLTWSASFKVPFLDRFDLVALTFIFQIFDQSFGQPISNDCVHVDAPLLPNFVGEEEGHHVVSHVFESSLGLFDGTFDGVG